jgi:hypothetical protein
VTKNGYFFVIIAERDPSIHNADRLVLSSARLPVGVIHSAGMDGGTIGTPRKLTMDTNNVIKMMKSPTKENGSRKTWINARIMNWNIICGHFT